MVPPRPALIVLGVFLVGQTTELVSVSSAQVQADGNSSDPAVRGLTVSSPDITANGRYVAFFSSVRGTSLLAAA